MCHQQTIEIEITSSSAVAYQYLQLALRWGYENHGLKKCLIWLTK